MSWDAATAVQYLDQHAYAESHSRCAHFTAEAIAAGGIRIHTVNSAKDFGPSLTAAGFIEVSGPDHQAGDVVVIQNIAGHPDGHMAMFDGHRWVSDFVQPRGFYPSHAYERAMPPYKLYRHP